MKNTMFDALRSIVQDVNDAAGLEQALDIIVARTRKLMQVDAVSVYFRDNKTDQLVLMATDGLNQNAIGKIRFTLNQGLVGLVIQQLETVNIEDAHSHPNYLFVTETDEISFHGFLGVPIIQHRHALGVLVVRQTRRRRFSENDETFLVTLAAQLAGAISHAEKVGELTQLLEGADKKSFTIKGLSGAPGIAIGEALVIFPAADLDAVPDSSIGQDEVKLQIEAFSGALDTVAQEYRALGQRMQGVIPSEELALFDVFGLMLKSDSLKDAVISRIRAGQWAQGALRQTIAEHAKQFDAMEDVYLRERAADIKDMGRRILTHLQAQQTEAPPVTGPVVLVGEEVSVSQFNEVPLQYLVGIISTKGSSSSHVAILAAALGIPAVMGVDDLPVSRIKGQQIIVDGSSGQIYVKPSAGILDEFQRLIAAEQLLDEELHELIDKPSATRDGAPISLQVNTGLLADISPSLQSGAEGVGLYRTEIPFLMRDGFPGEDEQTKIYQQVLRSFAPRPVTFRTLDIGGDKALPYFPVVEDNPFLGWRGIRIMLDHPEIFLTQLRAILRANVYGNNLRLMLPMISDIGEVDESLELIGKAHGELKKEGVDIPYPSIGVMIEVPSVISLMAAIARRVDFFSVGSNDLTQYLLAVDRNNKRVAKLYTCLHPAVLSSIQQIVDVSRRLDKPLSVCGEMAGDPASALALVGMGVNNLSMSAGSLLRVKCTIRAFSRQQASALVGEALAMERFSDIHQLFNNALIQAGLGGLVRSGK
ncbi:MAG: phosphoenolpyruvate--protein phosphotransferase [Gammaproteobacteria bacterium]|nr:phosphoenolpyruvate--protein phosphotransferase [Gammaproteobacteria bacterium]